MEEFPGDSRVHSWRQWCVGKRFRGRQAGSRMWGDNLPLPGLLEISLRDGRFEGRAALKQIGYSLHKDEGRHYCLGHYVWMRCSTCSGMPNIDI